MGIFYLLPVIAAVLIGGIRSRNLTGLLLFDLQGVLLLPVALLLALLPVFLGISRPGMIFTDDRHLLLALLALSRGLFLAFSVLNLLPALRRHQPPLRVWGLALASLGLILQLLVLLTNQGYWPLSPAYLNHVRDPLLIAGIQNGALRFSRLIDEHTHWAFLGQIIPWPALTKNTLAPVQFISPTDLILAVALFLIVFSLFPARMPARPQPAFPRKKYRQK